MHVKTPPTCQYTVITMMMVDGGCDFVLLCSYPGLHFTFALRAVVMAYGSNAYDILVNYGNRSTESDLTLQTSLYVVS